MRKLIIILAGSVLLLAGYPVLYLLVLPHFHDVTLERFAEPLLTIPPPADSKDIETLTRVGQQTANTDHCDYLAALMLETKLPKVEVEDYYRKAYKGKSRVEFVWLNEQNIYTAKEH